MSFSATRSRSREKVVRRVQSLAGGAVRLANVAVPIATAAVLRAEYERVLAVLGGARDPSDQSTDPNRPGRVSVFLFVLARFSREAAIWICCWVAAVFLVGSLDGRLTVLARLPSPLAFIFVAMLLALFAVGAIVMFSVGLGNVAIFLPTSQSVVSALLTDPEFAEPLQNARMRVRSENAGAAGLPAQARNLRMYIRVTSRKVAMTRLKWCAVAFVLVLACLASISFLLASSYVNLPLVVGPDGVTCPEGAGPVRHLYFLLTTFATIGFGDIRFVSSLRGYITGSIIAMLVLGAGGGLVTYLNHFVVGFNERISEGLELRERGADIV